MSVLRYARTCRYEIQLSRKDALIGRVELGSTGEDGSATPEAIGFRQVVDGLLFTVAPGHLADVPALPQDLLSRFRADYFLERLLTTDELPDQVSSFLREWLWQVSMAMLVATACASECTLSDAQRLLTGQRQQAAQKVLDAIFQVRDVAIDGAEEEARLRDRLLALWQSPSVLSVLERLEPSLWEPTDADFTSWVRRRYVATLAQAIRATAVSCVAELSEDDLAVDVTWQPTGGAQICLSETSSGGIGLIELVLTAMRRDPDAFQEGLRHYLSSCPREDITQGVLGVLRGASSVSGADVRSAFEAVRAAATYGASIRRREKICASLPGAGFSPGRALVVAIVSRLLGPGSSADTDRLTDALNTEWRKVERQLGVGIDARIFAYHCLKVLLFREPLRSHMERLAGVAPADAQMYVVLQRLLFSGCLDSCPECLLDTNQYVRETRPSRALARAWLTLDDTEVRVDQADWMAQVRSTLLRNGRVVISVPDDRMRRCADQLAMLLADELEAQYLLLPITLTRATKRARDWQIALVLKEAVAD